MKEISEALDIPDGTIKSRASHPEQEEAFEGAVIRKKRKGRQVGKTASN